MSGNTSTKWNDGLVTIHEGPPVEVIEGKSGREERSFGRETGNPRAHGIVSLKKNSVQLKLERGWGKK